LRRGSDQVEHQIWVSSPAQGPASPSSRALSPQRAAELGLRSESPPPRPVRARSQGALRAAGEPEVLRTPRCTRRLTFGPGFSKATKPCDLTSPASEPKCHSPAAEARLLGVVGQQQATIKSLLDRCSALEEGVAAVQREKLDEPTEAIIQRLVARCDALDRQQREQLSLNSAAEALFDKSCCDVASKVNRRLQAARLKTSQQQLQLVEALRNSAAMQAATAMATISPSPAAGQRSPGGKALGRATAARAEARRPTQLRRGAASPASAEASPSSRLFSPAARFSEQPTLAQCSSAPSLQAQAGPAQGCQRKLAANMLPVPDWTMQRQADSQEPPNPSSLPRVSWMTSSMIGLGSPPESGIIDSEFSCEQDRGFRFDVATPRSAAQAD
jgi:hypothetical protein